MAPEVLKNHMVCLSFEQVRYKFIKLNYELFQGIL